MRRLPEDVDAGCVPGRDHELAGLQRHPVAPLKLLQDLRSLALASCDDARQLLKQRLAHTPRPFRVTTPPHRGHSRLGAATSRL